MNISQRVKVSSAETPAYDLCKIKAVGVLTVLSRSCARYCALLLVILIPHLASAQKKVGEVCLTTTNKVVVRSKCALSEIKLSLNQLATRAPAGNKGATGPQGSIGRQVVYTVHNDKSIGSFGDYFSQACPAGKITVGGGCLPISREVNVYQSYPIDGSPNRWVCGIAPIVGVNQTVVGKLVTYAICVDQ